jgi:hypothetical protein
MHRQLYVLSHSLWVELLYSLQDVAMKSESGTFPSSRNIWVILQRGLYIRTRRTSRDHL